MEYFVLSSEESASYDASMSNLLALKMFHDEGLDVSGYPNFIIDINYDHWPSYEILSTGFGELFIEASTYFLHSEETPEKEIFERKFNHKDLPEFAILIRDFRIESLINSGYQKDLEELCKSCSAQFECYFLLLHESKEIVLYQHYESVYIHELADAGVHINRKLNEILLRVKGEKNGYHSQAI